ncbi:MAG: SseB family protein [Sulfitobacter sp.]
MTELTPLDRAFTAMDAAPDDDTARLRFYERLADAELLLLLKSDAGARDEQVTPELFDLGDAQYVLVFDRVERLAAFTGAVSPYVALSGRAIAGMLAGKDLGVGVNLDVAPSSILLPKASVDWLNETLGNAPDQVEARIAEVHPPKGLPDLLLSAIDAKLATATGLAQCAYLVGVVFRDGGRGHMLGFVGAVAQAEQALAHAAAEALVFSGIEAGSMDVGFFDAADDMTQKLARVGLRFDLPQLAEMQAPARPAPGSDPAKPPILK